MRKVLILPVVVLLLVAAGMPRHARAASSDANLSALSTTAGSLSPAFSVSTQGYLVTPATHIISATVTATTEDPGATMTITPPGGSAVALTSGVASAPFALAVGDNGVQVTVTAADTVTQKTYTLDISDPVGHMATLQSLVLGSGTLTPSFSAGGYSYTAATSAGTETLTATTTDPSATMSVSLNSGAAQPLTSGVSFGPQTLVALNTFVIDVTAQDGVNKASYTIIVSNAGSLSQVGGATVAPGTTVTASASGVSATLTQPSSAATSATLFVAQYPGNPAPATVQGLNYYDVQAALVAQESQVTVQFFCDSSGRSTIQSLQGFCLGFYYDPASGTYKPVQPTPGPSLPTGSSFNSSTHVLTLNLSSTSTPSLASLTGTVFALVAGTSVPQTGAHLAANSAAGLALVTCGVFLIVMARRRRRVAAAITRRGRNAPSGAVH